MKALDVMVTQVVTVTANATVQEVAEILVKHRISAIPVVDDQGKLVGIVSEGDLMRRTEIGTGERRSWWLRLLAREEALAADFVKANARKVKDVMTRDVIVAEPRTPLDEIVALLENNSIKRVPIVSNGQIVGIVSRANLVQAFAALYKELHLETAPNDATIREKLMQRLSKEPWAHTSRLNAIVNDGVVDLYGMVKSEIEKNAVRVAAESTPGVRAVNDNLALRRIEYIG